ncbi:YMGG-like glycine zipper-containing protein [Parasphingorhabdus sp.]|uniref:YMGG-like glycine zipper-containing protein n=1 Tax=Parasphingorhabdus sp. TaxID=2709688 RepID=UPI003A95C0DD
MITRTKQLALAATAALSLTACAENYAAEGAGAGAAAGAAIGAITGGDVLQGAAIGAAAGAAGGYFIDKNDGCDGYDRRGKLDDDCYGLRGYPDDPR